MSLPYDFIGQNLEISFFQNDVKLGRLKVS